jgi:rhamnulokinase
MNAIHIVGGGCKDDYLNSLTAKECGKTVYAGPKEATAIGNLAVQMIASGEFENLSHARKVIFDSFGAKKY